LFVVFFCSNCLGGLIITEIYANPVLDESENEWIEIYNDGDYIDLSGLVLVKNGKEIKIEGGFYNGTGMVLHRNSFALITNSKTRVYNNFNVSSSVLKLYTCSSLGGLKNSGDSFSLVLGDYIVNASYNSSKNGFSLIYDGKNYVIGSTTPGFHEDIDLHSCDYSISLSKVNESYKFFIKHENGENSNVSIFQEVRGFFNESYFKKNGEYYVVRQKTLTFNPDIDKNGIYFVEGYIDSSCDLNLGNNFVSYPLVINNFEICNSSEKIIYVNNTVYEKCGIELNKNYHLNKVYESDGLFIQRKIIYVFVLVLILIVIAFVA